MQTYRTEKENENNSVEGYKTDLASKAVIEELQSASSRISDIEIPLYIAMGDCPSCPSCLCTKAKYLLPLAPGGIAATTPIMIACKAATFAP